MGQSEFSSEDSRGLVAVGAEGSRLGLCPPRRDNDCSALNPFSCRNGGSGWARSSEFSGEAGNLEFYEKRPNCKRVGHNCKLKKQFWECDRTQLKGRRSL